MSNRFDKRSLDGMIIGSPSGDSYKVHDFPWYNLLRWYRWRASPNRAIMRVTLYNAERSLKVTLHKKAPTVLVVERF